MARFPIGVILDSFRTGFDEAIRIAERLGLDGVQFYAVGDYAPLIATAEGRRQVASELRARNLALSALCGDLGGHGFAVRSQNADRIAHTRTIMEQAADLGCGVVTTHIGVIPADPEAESRLALRDAMQALGEHGDRIGVQLAIETGPEPSAVLLDFLASLETRSVGVNLDPANLVMVTDEDPVQAVGTLSGRILHTHAKDGVLLRKTDPRRVYDYFADGGIGDLRLEELFRETPLGAGSVDFPRYLAALGAVGYRGFLTIERETGNDPTGDIRHAVSFLKALTGDS